MLKRRRTFQAQEIGELDFSEELLELGVLIGSYRTARGIKQEDMAQLLGMSRITLSRIENSWLPLTMENFFKMAAIFEVRPEYLLQELARVTQRKWRRCLLAFGRSCVRTDVFRVSPPRVAQSSPRL